MAGKALHDIHQGESGWRVLDKLRRERSIAIDNLSISSSSRIAGSTRLPPISSPVPKLMVNSREVGDDGDVIQYSAEQESDDTQLRMEALDDDSFVCTEYQVGPNDPGRRHRMPSAISKDEVARGIAVLPCLSLPEVEGSPNGVPLQRRSSLDTLAMFHKDKDLLSCSLGATKAISVTQSLGRSRSPSPSTSRKSAGGPSYFSGHMPNPRTSPSSSRGSTGSSPDISPSLARRGSPSSTLQSTTGNIRGPPMNTEGRLKTRSAQYKLQKFLEETKSQFTTAQTLEMYAQTSTNDAEHK